MRTLGAVVFVLVVVVVLASLEFFRVNHLRTDTHTADQPYGGDRMMYTR